MACDSFFETLQHQRIPFTQIPAEPGYSGTPSSMKELGCEAERTQLMIATDNHPTDNHWNSLGVRLNALS